MDNTYKTKIELLADDSGEYINLKKKAGDKWIETSFYIDDIDFNRKEDTIYATTFSGFKHSIPNYDWNVVFKCKKDENGGVVKMTTIVKEMTIEEIERELGYKVEIIN